MCFLSEVSVVVFFKNVSTVSEFIREETLDCEFLLQPMRRIFC